MSRRFARRAQQQETGEVADALLAPLLDLAAREERRIAAWSPDPLEEEAPSAAKPPAAEPEPPAPVAAVGPPPVRASAPGPPRKRGRPRSKAPRRQVHFHVDRDEEELLLAAARLHGSQQKGIVAALQALKENESLRDEIGRLRDECERQRQLLVRAESLFKG
ncbi:MAG TPA: hypothetical protein VFL60_03600 [Gaiellaceae bacterium]|nr:hypothetical protein [Gaiellaceae bacterium]